VAGPGFEPGGGEADGFTGHHSFGPCAMPDQGRRNGCDRRSGARPAYIPR
jgi:hypothetical protein